MTTPIDFEVSLYAQHRQINLKKNGLKFIFHKILNTSIQTQFIWTSQLPKHLFSNVDGSAHF